MTNQRILETSLLDEVDFAIGIANWIFLVITCYAPIRSCLSTCIKFSGVTGLSKC